MDKKTFNEILNIASSVLTEEEYNNLVYLIKNNRWNALRIFTSDKLEELEILSVLDRDNQVLRKEIELCNRLVDIVLDVYLEVAL